MIFLHRSASCMPDYIISCICTGSSFSYTIKTRDPQPVANCMTDAQELKPSQTKTPFRDSDKK